jgi:KTSC domain
LLFVLYEKGMRLGALLLLFLTFAATCGVAAEPGETIISNVARLPVESSALASVGYSRYLQVLEVEFRNGAVYRYIDVPENIFHELIDAPSKTGYYDANVRGKYRSYHVQPAAP